MKKINIVFLAILTLFLSSCEEDSETNLVPKNYLAGKWVPTKVGSLNAIGGIVYVDYVNNAECSDDNLLLNENFTYTANDYEFEDSECVNYNISGSYTLNGSNLVLKYIDDIDGEIVETRRITNLTYTEMDINYTDSETNQIVFLKLVKM